MEVAFPYIETLGLLIVDFYSKYRKAIESEDAFLDELQVLVQILVCNLEIYSEAHETLKHQQTDE